MKIAKVIVGNSMLPNEDWKVRIEDSTDPSICNSKRICRCDELDDALEIARLIREKIFKPKNTEW